jgi:hypothetical protein
LKIIHNNGIPCHFLAKVVSDLKGLGRFAYSGHSVIMEKTKMDWQSIDYVQGSWGGK